MRAASREAYGAAAEQLNQYARGADPAQLAKIGDELLSVAALLGREPRLRRALADPARSGSERAALLDGLVGEQVDAETRKVLNVALRGRWSGMSELLDGIELLGVESLLAGVDNDGTLGEVEDELFRFGQIVDSSS